MEKCCVQQGGETSLIPLSLDCLRFSLDARRMSGTAREPSSAPLQSEAQSGPRLQKSNPKGEAILEVLAR